MTAQERLVGLSGATGLAGALLLAIGSGSTAAAVLMNYSGLSSAAAQDHLLSSRTVETVTQFVLPADMGNSELATGANFPAWIAEKQRIRRGW